MAKHLSTRDGPSSLFNVGYEHWERRTRRGEETSTRFALQCGSNMLEKFINTTKDLWLMLQSKLFCISAIAVSLEKGYAKNTHSASYNIIFNF